MRYVVPLDLADDIYNRFTYHPPINDQTVCYARLRNEARKLALSIAENTPPSREQSLALTHLETAIFFANAAIARNEVAILPSYEAGEDDDLPF